MMQNTAKIRPRQRAVSLNQSSWENQKYIETGKRRTNATMLNLITRLTVMMAAYLRCKARARYRSKLMAVMADNDTKTREEPTGYNMAPEIQYTEKLYVNTPTRCVTSNGWMNVPVAKSDNARTNSSTEDGVCNEGVFLMAHRTKKFAVAAVKLDKMFTTQMAIVARKLVVGKFPGNITGQLRLFTLVKSLLLAG